MSNEITEIRSNGDQMLAMIAQVAQNPDADIVKMERLMEMRDKEFARLAKQAFSADYVNMKPQLPVVVKTKYNTQTKSKYAALEDINISVDKILAKCGFSTSTKVIGQDETSVTVEAILWHSQGHTESTQVTMPLDRAGIAGTVNKTNVHAIASSITYAKRVAICALLNISTGDDTDGNREPELPYATEEQRVAMSGIYQTFTQDQKDKFDEITGGILEIKRPHFDKIIAKMKVTQKENEAVNAGSN